MDNEIQQFVHDSNLQPGDVIIARKRGYRVLDHFIVYLGLFRSGNLFMANSMDRGVRQYSEEEVLELVKSFEPIKIRNFIGDDVERELSVDRAFSLEGKPYSLFTHNCEHFANYVQYGKKESPQVGLWVLTAFVGIIFGLASYSDK